MKHFLFLKHIKKLGIYLIVDFNNKIISQLNFSNYIDNISYSCSLKKYNLIFKHLGLFGLLPSNNSKEFF
jgi:hypothetical protein